MNYENIEKLYAPYNKLKIDLDEVEISENKCNKLSKIPKLQNNKCNNVNNNKESTYIFDKSVKKTGDCKDLLYNDKVKNINNERKNSHKMTYNKSIKQLYPRSIITIPYKTKKTYEYNPEIETLMQSGLLNSNKKCVTNTGEIKSKMTPLQSFVKDKINNKKNLFDISRFQLSSRQLKGDKTYLNNYKDKISSIKKFINKNNK